ncbi:hypothetical protein BDW74DRAFT_147393 [Aspergillus multicolor]|uniref:uncharacterized protein n=1 Tax=Aspergillus multicolor TaxID=41759 RepID=UPI003CCE1CF2
MVSSAMVSPQALRNFSRLNNQISLYTSSQQPRGSHEPPTLVVVCAWLFAAPKHIAKYTQLY